MSDQGISIIVCTRNRAGPVAACLAGLSEAVSAHPDILCEVVLVDNGSTDNTDQVLREWAKAQPFQVKVVHEAKPGLASARNAGIKASQHAILAMTDDDCVVARDYLAQLAAAHAACDAPSIVGGRVVLGDPKDLPLTLRLGDDRQTYLRSNMKPGGFIIGANLSLHRAVYDRVGAFDERFGAGAKFIASEDSDFFFRASLLGIPVVFDPRTVVSHFHGRRGPNDARNLQRGYSFGSGALYAKHLLRSGDVARYVATALKDAAREFIHPPRGDPTGLRWLHWFRLAHMTRGFVAFLTTAPVRDDP